MGNYFLLPFISAIENAGRGFLTYFPAAPVAVFKPARRGSVVKLAVTACMPLRLTGAGKPCLEYVLELMGVEKRTDICKGAVENAASTGIPTQLPPMPFREIVQGLLRV